MVVIKPVIKMNNKIKEKLFHAAKKARKHAYTPYSNFRVGAALLAKTGEIYTGCNIENVSYSLTNCAERTAIFKAISEGEQNFEALLLLTDTEDLISPCGACRQVIREFGDDITILMANLDGDIKKINISDLLPTAFNKGDLNDK